MLLRYMRTMKRRGRGYQFINAAPQRHAYTATLQGRWAGLVGPERGEWAGSVSPERGGWAGLVWPEHGEWAELVRPEQARWAGRVSHVPYDSPAYFSTPDEVKSLRAFKQEDRKLPIIPAPSPGVYLPSITDQDFLITCLTRHIEYLHKSKGLSAPKKASSGRSVDSVHEPAICCDWLQSAKVLGHHHNNKLRMLTHRWKRLGLHDPVSSNSNDHTPEQSHRNYQLARTTDSLQKITPIKASQGATQRDNDNTNGFDISEVAQVSDRHSSSNTPVSSECHTDSDLSDQDKEIIDMVKWVAAVELDLKPEPFDDDLDLDYCSTETAFYPEVLPVSLKVLDSTQMVSSAIQESLCVTDPCLAPVIARLIELERLQAATVQKERAKLARSRPTTANTRNGNRLRKSDLPGCKKEILNDAECSCVVCSSTKLMVCPNSSCICRHHTCPLTKSDQGRRSRSSHPTLPKRPDSMSGKSKKTQPVLPTVNKKVQQKPTVPNRTKSPKTHGGSTTAKKATVPNKKT